MVNSVYYVHLSIHVLLTIHDDHINLPILNLRHLLILLIIPVMLIVLIMPVMLIVLIMPVMLTGLIMTPMSPRPTTPASLPSLIMQDTLTDLISPHMSLHI